MEYQEVFFFYLVLLKLRWIFSTKGENQMDLLKMSLQTSVIKKQILDYIDNIESHCSRDELFRENKIT